MERGKRAKQVEEPEVLEAKPYTEPAPGFINTIEWITVIGTVILAIYKIRQK